MFNSDDYLGSVRSALVEFTARRDELEAEHFPHDATDCVIIFLNMFIRSNEEYERTHDGAHRVPVFRQAAKQ